MPRDAHQERLTIEAAAPDSADARHCIAGYFNELRQRLEAGFDPDRTARVADAEIAPPAGLLLLARLDGRAVGCGALRVKEDGIGEIKRLWVDESARGRGVARRLMQALEAEARSRGLSLLRLDTNRALSEAFALYQSCGFEEVAAFNAEPYAHHWFAKRLD